MRGKKECSQKALNFHCQRGHLWSANFRQIQKLEDGLDARTPPWVRIQALFSLVTKLIAHILFSLSPSLPAFWGWVLHLTVVTLLLCTRLLPVFLLCVLCVAWLNHVLKVSLTLYGYFTFYCWEYYFIFLVYVNSLLICACENLGCKTGKKKGVVTQRKVLPCGANVQQVGSSCWWLFKLPG